MDGQPRLTDLVPKKISTLVMLYIAGLLVVAGLEASYYWMPEVASRTTDGKVASLDLDDEGSLAVWFSSATLALAGLVSLLTYVVRRHRLDDYQGRYRIWLWAGCCWMLMSLDETASLHEGFKELMTHATGYRLLGDGSIWWVMPYFGLLGIVGIRLMLEMRENKAAMSLLTLAAGTYAVAVAAQLEWVMPKTGARGVMLEEGCEMVGNLFVLFSMLVAARHIILDAGGLLVHEAPVKKKRKGTAAMDSGSKGEGTSNEPRLKTGVEASKPAPLAGKLAKAPHGGSTASASSNTPSRVDPAEDSASRAKMTKAERKAMRRQQQQDRDDYR